MGLFDGASGRGELASTAHVAKLLRRARSCSCVDASAMARSAAAIVHGFRTFDPDVDVAGVIFNKVGSDIHEQLLREAVEAAAACRCSARCAATSASSRPSATSASCPSASASRRAPRRARRAGRGDDPRRRPRRGPAPGARRARARRPRLDPRAPATHGRGGRADRDRPRPGVLVPLPGEPRAARRRRRGARARSTRSPTRRCPARRRARARRRLPGGLRRRALGERARCAREVAAFAASGRPVLAECGGLLYLCRSLDGHEMCGVLPARRADGRPPDARLPRGGRRHRARRGSRPASACAGTSSTTRAWTRTSRRPAWQLSARGVERTEGIVAEGVQASYLHVHWAAYPELARAFAGAAARAGAAAWA